MTPLSPLTSVGILVVLALFTLYAIEAWQGNIFRRWLHGSIEQAVRLHWFTAGAVWMALALDVVVGLPTLLPFTRLPPHTTDFSGLHYLGYVLLLASLLRPPHSASWLPAPSD